jgi:Co/Zn/Cd efflux system component
MTPIAQNTGLRRAVAIVAILNLGYFVVEFFVALHIGSVSLLADSIDFLEDASVNVLILLALGWSLRHRARLGMLLAAILLVPALAGIWVAFMKLTSFVPPAATPLTVTGVGALAVNLSCAFLLATYRNHGGSLTRAAFLSARNDALANMAIICAGFVTSVWPTIWPDLVVGIGIAILNADAAREVWSAARSEHRAAKA